MKKSILLLGALFVLLFTATPTNVDAQTKDPDTRRICRTVEVENSFLWIFSYTTVETRCSHQYTYEEN
ncbi:hypothetical protein Phi19:3_gp125 [Cellulophaga phage phi19:3]|uniref:Uncharacterized protein n=1 Tax=Cellulophaga phage phi19:3 TaxID=1327971 RepID=R9ZWG2_9CAUD|nr:hypothetical protein Phi19:3_gp125 [Cellulophaga phage phi19:3]AGO47529.1 hypothetical protein Phi19:3_gp125 [Cellulophaga phage phi19:3]